jgi:hypothetical protein
MLPPFPENATVARLRRGSFLPGNALIDRRNHRIDRR